MSARASSKQNPRPSAQTETNSTVSSIGAPGTVLTFAITLPPSLLGKGASRIWADLLRFSKAVEKKTGMEIRLVKTKSQDDTIKLLEKDSAQFAWVEPYSYAKEKSKRALEFSPLVVYQSGASTSSRTCIYKMSKHGGGTKSTADKDKGLAAMRDGRNVISLTGEADWSLLNKIFQNERYTFEPHFFFSGFSVTNSESAALSLLFDDSYSAIMNELAMKYMVEMDKRLKSAQPLVCAPALPNTMIAISNSVAPEERRLLLEVFLNMRGDKDFAFLNGYFATTNGKWVAADIKTFIPWEKLYKQAAEAGWDKTFDVLPLK